MASTSRKVITPFHSVLVRQQLERCVLFAPTQVKKAVKKQERAPWPTSAVAEAQNRCLEGKVESVGFVSCDKSRL